VLAGAAHHHLVVRLSLFLAPNMLLIRVILVHRLIALALSLATLHNRIVDDAAERHM